MRFIAYYQVPDITTDRTHFTYNLAMKDINPPVSLEKPENEKSLYYCSHVAKEFREEEEYTEVFFDHVRRLWTDKGVQSCFERSNEYQLIDCAKYFLDQVQNIRRPDYYPTDQDLLRCRVLTQGIFETKFSIEKGTGSL